MALAARGRRHLDGQEEPVPDADEAAALRRRARGLQLRALAIAAGVTAALVGVRLALA